MTGNANRRHQLTKKVSTPFGSMYIHIELDNEGHTCGGSISHPGKDEESTVAQLIENLSTALNEALDMSEFKEGEGDGRNATDDGRGAGPGDDEGGSQ